MVKYFTINLTVLQHNQGYFHFVWEVQCLVQMRTSTETLTSITRINEAKRRFFITKPLRCAHCKFGTNGRILYIC